VQVINILFLRQLERTSCLSDQLLLYSISWFYCRNWKNSHCCGMYTASVSSCQRK